MTAVVVPTQAPQTVIAGLAVLAVAGG